MFELDEKFVKSLIRDRFGRLTIPASSCPKEAGGVDRTTLWRSYQSRKLPSAPVLFSLAGTLDVDPLALIGIRRGRSFPELIGYFEKYLWALTKPKEFEKILKLSDFLTCKNEWPCENHSRKYYGRSWFRKLVNHDSGRKSNYYGKFEVKFTDPGIGKVIHFSWRTESRDRWHPYGSVRLLGQGTELFCYDGFTHRVEIPKQPVGFTVETWFGSGSADFSIASLHEFEVREVKEVDTSLPLVGFRRLNDR